MNTPISQDFERLSAYVDNQLSPAEKSDLEGRLAREPELQASLGDLRRTVQALRSLPPVKPPRSFTLTPEQAGVRARRGPLFPVFRLAAALCTLLLGLAVARDFAAGGLATSGSRDLTTQSGASTALSAPNAAALDTPTPEGSLEAYGASALLPTSTRSADVKVTPVLHMAPVGSDATPTANDQQLAATADATHKNVAPTETPADTAISVAALPPSATQSLAPNLAPQAQAPTPASLRLVEIVLAGLALALAAGAWLTRRG